MIEELKLLWRDLMTPSTKAETLHYWGAIQATHACIGAFVAALATLLFGGGLLSFGLCIVFGLWYAFVKERNDIKLGGTYRDSAADTFFVWFGLLVTGGSFFFGLFMALLVGVLFKAYLDSER